MIYRYELPSHDGVMYASLVEAIPHRWAWMEGVLEAPARLLDNGRALDKLGFAFRRNIQCALTYADRAWIPGTPARHPLADDGLYALLCEQKLPGFLHFEEVGDALNAFSLRGAKRIAAHFLRIGYRGELFFYREFIDQRKLHNSARCEFHFDRWNDYEVAATEQIRERPPTMLLHLVDKGDPNELFGGLIPLCARLKLRRQIGHHPRHLRLVRDGTPK